MRAARLLDTLLTSLVLLSFLHRCDAAPATTTSIPKNALPPVVPPDSSVESANSWASRSVYNITQSNANSTIARARFRRRDDSDLDYVADPDEEEEGGYSILLGYDV